MTIKAKIPTTKKYVAGILQNGSIRVSKPQFEIKPAVSLSNLSDAISADAENDEALIYSVSSGKFIPTDITDIREEITTINRVVGGNF